MIMAMSFVDLSLFVTMMVSQTVVSYPSQDIHISLPRMDASEITFSNEHSDEYSKNLSEDLSINAESDYHFYSRADWNAKPATDKRPLKTPTPYVVIHHTYIPGACYNPEDCKAAMGSMQNYHMSMDWGDIGYNFCVGSEGGAYEGRGWQVVGIHAGNANNISVGICLIGDWRTEVPPSQQIATTKALIATGVRKGVISPNYKLIGHRQARSTECPGDALFNLIQTWEHFVPEYVPL